MRSRNVKWAGCVTAAVILLAGLAGQGRAAGLTEPKVEYSADQHVIVGDKIVKSKVYHAPKKQRMDIEEGGEKQHIITRLDRKVLWIVMPGQKMYIERSIDAPKEGQSSRDIKECDIHRKESGKETVNGIVATKSAVEVSCPDGARYSGDIWESKEGIVVKMDVTAKGEKSTAAQIRSELKNLKVGKQDPALFEVPSGFQQMKMPFGMMPGEGGGGKKSAMEMPPSDEKDQQEPDSPKEKGNIGADAVRKLKGLFGK